MAGKVSPPQLPLSGGLDELASAGEGARIGKYRLKRLLARGGMGAVWVAVDCDLERDVAIKFMDPHIAEDTSLRERFFREAKAAARLRTPHVVQVYEHGVEQDLPYIVMELLEGEDLHARLKRDLRVQPHETVVILRQIAKGLRAAHQEGIVHRDLKPQNIFLSEQDDEIIVKILDFGVAKMQIGAAEGTKTGAVLGSPHYMSPEQARGMPVDARSDVWALGVIAYRILTGRMAFPGQATGDVIVRICTEVPPAPSELFDGVPPEVDAFFVKALQRDPDERFQSARELVKGYAEAIAKVDELIPLVEMSRMGAEGTTTGGGISYRTPSSSVVASASSGTAIGTGASFAAPIADADASGVNLEAIADDDSEDDLDAPTRLVSGLDAQEALAAAGLDVPDDVDEADETRTVDEVDDSAPPVDADEKEPAESGSFAASAPEPVADAVPSSGMRERAATEPSIAGVSATNLVADDTGRRNRQLQMVAGVLALMLVGGIAMLTFGDPKKDGAEASPAASTTSMAAPAGTTTAAAKPTAKPVTTVAASAAPVASAEPAPTASAATSAEPAASASAAASAAPSASASAAPKKAPPVRVAPRNNDWGY